jgi:hypothetical protein
MNKMIVRHGLWMVGNHPRRALRMSLIAAPRATKMRGATRGRRMVTLIDPIRRAATEPKIRKEVRKAAADVSSAFARAQRVGVTDAIGDRRVARKLRLAALHTSRATRHSIDHPHHRARNATIVILGTGAALTGAAYGGWKMSSRTEESGGVQLAGDTSDVTPDDVPAQAVATAETTATAAEGDHHAPSPEA